jgi:hypothetical protein
MHSLRRSAAVLLAGSLVLTCTCSRIGRSVRIEPIGAGIAKESVLGVMYPDFRHAFANLDFSGIADQELDDFSRALMKGMRLIMAGEMAGAESIFRELAAAAVDSWSKTTAGEILIQLLFFQSKWKELHELLAPTSGAEDAADKSKVPFKELSQIPVEKYQFPAQPVIFPLELSSSGTPMIRLQINGKWEKFWLDSGAGFTVLASDLADKLGISPLNRTRTHAATGTNKRVEARLTVIESIRIGDLEISHHPAMIVPKKDLFFKIPGLFSGNRITKIIGVKGILGMNAIKNLSLCIDYRNRRVIISRPEKKTGQTRNFFWMGYPIVVTQSMAGVPLYFGLDTGAKKSMVSFSILAKISSQSTYMTRMRIWGAGGAVKTMAQILPNLKIQAAGQLVSFKDIAAMPLIEIGFVHLDGILGMDFVAGCNSLTLDLKNGVLAFY